MMIYLLQCKRCLAHGWAHGEDEPDVNATTFGDEPIDWGAIIKLNIDSCDHEDFEIIDSEYDSDD